MFAQPKGLVRSFPDEVWDAIASIHQQEGIANAFMDFLKRHPVAAVLQPGQPGYAEQNKQLKYNFSVSLYNHYLCVLRESNQSVADITQLAIYEELNDALAICNPQQDDQKKCLLM